MSAPVGLTDEETKEDETPNFALLSLKMKNAAVRAETLVEAEWFDRTNLEWSQIQQADAQLRTIREWVTCGYLPNEREQLTSNGCKIWWQCEHLRFKDVILLWQVWLASQLEPTWQVVHPRRDNLNIAQWMHEKKRHFGPNKIFEWLQCNYYHPNL